MERNNTTVQAFWVGIGSFSSFALGFVSAAILSRYFDKAEYGTYRQILYVYTTLLVIFTAGLPSVFAYFLPRYSLSRGKDIVLKVSKVLFLAGLAFSIFLFLFSGLLANVLKNPELSRGLKYFSPIPMLLLPTLGLEGIFSTYKRTILIAIYNALSRTLMLLFIVLPVVLFEGSYLYAIYGWIFISVITLVLAYFFIGIPFKGVTAEKSNLGIREILKYSLPIASAGIAGTMIKAADQFYIGRYFGTEVFAEFANGFVELPFVGMITGAIATVLMPMFSKIIYDKSDLNQLISLWQNALQKSVILIYPMAIFCIFYSQEIMTIIYSDTYSGSAKYFTAAMTINFFNIIVFAPLLFSLGETRFYAKLHFGLAIVSWLFGYITVIIFNTPYSIAILSVILSIFKIGIALYYSAKVIGVKFITLFPVDRFLIIAFHSVLSLFIVNVLLRLIFSDPGNFVFIIVAGMAFLILLIITSKWFKIDYLGILIPLFHRNKSAI
jgi:O-antigen/teichoic acid export membrane protein